MPKKNLEALRDRRINKSTAFTRQERDELGLTGLLPYAVSDQRTQIMRVMANLDRKANNIEKYVLLSALQDRNERLFFRTLMTHIEQLLPIIYTPTVGQACREFSQIFRQSKGFYITPADKGSIRRILDNYGEDDIRVIVVTDGQRILGLGDLGANGMGIPIGKLSLYTAGAGIHPNQCLPVMLDVGTNNDELLNDVLYLGYPHRRISGDEYFELVDEFVWAVNDKYPSALIQFEDFLTPNAYALLKKYRERVLCFNDDIQGTASVALAGVYASSRITGIPFEQTKIMFLGAGSAATGIADLAIKAFERAGLSYRESLQRLWFVDVDGLLVAGRKNLMEHNLPYAHSHQPLGFIDAIDAIQPNVLIGASGAGGTFTRDVIEHLCAYQDRPVIFALSNPTSKSECTAEQAYTWSRGKAVFASGSPFAEVQVDGQRFIPGQGNNAYIFPGIGLGALISRATKLPEELFLTAAKALADQVSDDEIALGSVYPPLSNLPAISQRIAEAIARKAIELKVAPFLETDLATEIENYVYDPSY